MFYQTFVCLFLCWQDNSEVADDFLMKFFGGVQCVTSKNWLDFGGDPDHVTSGLGLQLPWWKFALSEFSCSVSDDMNMHNYVRNGVITEQMEVGEMLEKYLLPFNVRMCKMWLFWCSAAILAHCCSWLKPGFAKRNSSALTTELWPFLLVKVKVVLYSNRA